jgi:class 3 adenylate cyclase
LVVEPTLRAAFEALQRVEIAAVVWDVRWQVVGVTDEVRAIFGGGVERTEPPLGTHLFSHEWVEFQLSRPGGATLESQRDAFAAVAPALLASTRGGTDELRVLVDPRLHDLLCGIEPAWASLYWSTRFDVNFGARTVAVDAYVAPVHDPNGRWVGGTMITKPGIRGAILSMLSLGDAALFERMAPLMRPARRPAAILFADLESSTALARRLSTQAYFALIRRLVVRADESVVRAGGIVGKHVGDGITAFFLAEHAGSESAAARACIEAARSMRNDAVTAAERTRLNPSDAVLRFGLHWGPGAYIGRLFTSGRTEVTALGDDVNEASRIEACATGGRALASKSLIERLDADDADALGLEPGSVTYTTLADVPRAPDKARRDAPAIAVADIWTEHAEPSPLPDQDSATT